MSRQPIPADDQFARMTNSHNLARLVAPTLMRIGPVMAVALLLGGMGPPVSAAGFLAFALAVTVGFVLGGALLTVLTATCFWTVAGRGVVLLNMAVLSLFSHLFLYMRSHGFDPAAASLGLSLFSLAGLAGKLASGWLSDRVDPYRLLRLQMFTMLAGLLGVTFVPGFIWLFLVVTSSKPSSSRIHLPAFRSFSTNFFAFAKPYVSNTVSM